MKDFERQIKRFNDKALDQTKAVFRQSAQEVVEIAQTPVSKGGRMRIDTNFLRASGGAGINQMPSGPTENESGESVPDRVTGMGVVEALARWKPGDTFYFGWSSSYSRPREAKDGFMRGAAEKWQSIVASVARRVGK